MLAICREKNFKRIFKTHKESALAQVKIPEQPGPVGRALLIWTDNCNSKMPDLELSNRRSGTTSQPILKTLYREYWKTEIL